MNNSCVLPVAVPEDALSTGIFGHFYLVEMKRA